jgi:hypothetical protein
MSAVRDHQKLAHTSHRVAVLGQLWHLLPAQHAEQDHAERDHAEREQGLVARSVTTRHFRVRRIACTAPVLGHPSLFRCVALRARRSRARTSIPLGCVVLRVHRRSVLES